MALCPHCMTEYIPHTGIGDFCTNCRSSLPYQAKPHQLPAGTILTDGAFRSFEIGAVKGQGGFGITYIALDLRRKMRVAIKEYFPIQCAQRSGIQVQATPGMEKVFAGGQSNFLKEAKMLAALPPMDSVVQIMDYFEVNGTAYIAMEYLDGTPLHRMVQSSGPIDAEQLIPRLASLLQNLKQLHAADIIHRDISPDNIMWMADGSMKLLDFGSARHLEDGKSVSIQLKHGFAPVEQYLTKGQGPYTDIYALCASIYYCLTGRVPSHAAQRLEQDDLIPPSQLGIRVPMEWEEALLWGLTVQPKARPQDVDSLLRRMFPGGVPEYNPFRSEVPPAPEPKPEPEPAPETTYQPTFDPTVEVGSPKIEYQPPVYDPHQYQGESGTVKKPDQKKPVNGLLEKIIAIPLATKIIAGAAAIIVILLIVLISLLTGKDDKPETMRQPDPAPVVEQVQEPVKEEEAPVKEEPAPEPEPEPAPEPEPVEPEELITEDGFRIELVDGEAHVIGYEGSDLYPDVPEYASDRPVTTIASGAFENSSIGLVNLPGTVVHIEENAFLNSQNLVAITYVSEGSPLRSDDTFEGCGNLMMILVDGENRWQGYVPDTAIVCYPGMETELGTLSDFEFFDDGSLYGLIDGDLLTLMKADPSLTELQLPVDYNEELVYILDGALEGAHELESVTLTDYAFFPYSFYDDLMAVDNVNCNFDSMSFSWLFSCESALRANNHYGHEQVLPDMDIMFTAMLRAEELVESYTSERPDGSEWDTILDENGIEWNNCYQRGSSSDLEDQALLDKMEERMENFNEDPYDEDGNPFDRVGFGIAADEESYYLVWVYIN